MAYGLKYTFNFKTLLSYHNIEEYYVRIYEDGFVGKDEVVEVDAGTVTLSRDGSQFEWVNGTKFSFSLLNITEEQYEEFRTATYGQYYCELKAPVDTIFTGYLQSEIYTEGYNDAPYSARLDFTCGISHLKYVRFQNGGELYSGQMHLLQVFRLCLNELPIPLSIREFMNIYEDDMTSTTTSSMLTQTYIDVAVHREQKDGVEVGRTCHDVLEEILKCFNTHLYIADNLWHFVRWQEYSDATMYYRQFLPRVGSENTTTVDASGSLTTNKRIAGLPSGTSSELIIVGASSEMSIEPPINRIKLTYNQDFNGQTNTNLIKNGCLQTIISNNYAGYPSYWEYYGVNPNTYSALFGTGGIGGANWFTFDDIDESTFNSGKYIKQIRENLYCATTDTLQISLTGFQKIAISKAVSQADYFTINYFLNGGWYRYYTIQIKIGSYYLEQTGSNSGIWTLTPSYFYLKGLGSGYQMPFWVDNYNAQITDNHVIYTAALPVNGFNDVEMSFFQPYSNVEPQDTILTDFTIDVEQFGIRCASVIYKPDTNAAITDYIVYQEIDEDEEVLDLDIVHGDGLYDFSINSFRLSDGTVTNAWNRRGKTENETIFNQILLQYAEMRGFFCKNISGNIQTQMKPYNTIEHTVNGTATHYMIKDYSYKLESDEWDVNLIEITNTPPSLTPDITVTYKYVGGNEEQPTPLLPQPKENNVIVGDSTFINNQYLDNFI